MNLEHYEYVVSELSLYYTFESIGPKGNIKKIISFVPHNVDGVTYFNLAFGDYIEDTGMMNDLAVSDNKDTDKILATIAAVVLDFFERFPDIWLYAKGSTPARTRLYQMGISKNWADIFPLLMVYGLRRNGWLPFEKNVSYNAFLVSKKHNFIK